MGTAHDAHSKADHHAHAHAHDFDGEPARALPPDEPRTSGYIPLAGILFFVTAGVLFLVSSGGDPATAPSKPSDTSGNQQAAAPPAAAPPAAPAAPGGAAPGATPPGGIQRLNPEQAKMLQQRINEARARQAVEGAQMAPGPGQPVQGGGAAPGQPPPAPPPAVRVPGRLAPSPPGEAQ